MYTDVYICILNNSYVKFNVYDLSLCINKVVISACLFVRPIITHKPIDFDLGTR